MHWDGSELNHLQFGFPAIVGMHVHRHDPVHQQADVVAQRAGIFDRVQHAIVRGQPADKQSSDAGSTKMAIQGGMVEC